MAVIFMAACPEVVSDRTAQSVSWSYDGTDYSQHGHTRWSGHSDQQKSRQARCHLKKNKRREETRAGNNLPNNEWTTICFRNVSNTYSNSKILQLLDANGFKDEYNFIYVPHDFRRLPVLANLGYFFANFTTHEASLRAWVRFDGFKDWDTPSDKVIAPSWATQTQGLHACVEKYQKSPVMHPDVPVECKPLIIENGTAVQLAPSGHQVKAPRFKTNTPNPHHAYIDHQRASKSKKTCEDVECISTTDASFDMEPCDSSSTTADGSSDGGESPAGESAQMEPSTIWMPDEAADSCLKCEMSFTFLRRRHHCRSCSRIFCAECAPRTCSRQLEQSATVTPTRLCGDCAESLDLSTFCVRTKLLKKDFPKQTRVKKTWSSLEMQPSDEPHLVVKNTFVTLPRSPSIECLVRGRVNSFPL